MGDRACWDGSAGGSTCSRRLWRGALAVPVHSVPARTAQHRPLCLTCHLYRRLSDTYPLAAACPAARPTAFGAARAGETIAATFAAVKVKDDVVKAVGLVSVFCWSGVAGVRVSLMLGFGSCLVGRDRRCATLREASCDLRASILLAPTISMNVTQLAAYSSMYIAVHSSHIHACDSYPSPPASHLCLPAGHCPRKLPGRHQLCAIRLSGHRRQCGRHVMCVACVGKGVGSWGCGEPIATRQCCRAYLCLPGAPPVHPNESQLPLTLAQRSEVAPLSLSHHLPLPGNDFVTALNKNLAQNFPASRCSRCITQTFDQANVRGWLGCRVVVS